MEWLSLLDFFIGRFVVTLALNDPRKSVDPKADLIEGKTISYYSQSTESSQCSSYSSVDILPQLTIRDLEHLGQEHLPSEDRRELLKDQSIVI